MYNRIDHMVVKNRTKILTANEDPARTNLSTYSIDMNRLPDKFSSIVGNR